MNEWVKDEDHRVTANDRHPLELYAQLTDDEFLYVQELQRVYDESRCYFVQWILSKETKELVNSARISAVQQNKKFTWTHTRFEILKSLTDVPLTARFLSMARLKRKHGSTAKVWISQVLTRRALLEDTKLPTPLHMELTVGQMSSQETTLFECPCIGDDLNERDRSGDLNVVFGTIALRDRPLLQPAPVPWRQNSHHGTPRTGRSQSNSEDQPKPSSLQRQQEEIAHPRDRKGRH
jgi:hypothetical protein